MPGGDPSDGAGVITGDGGEFPRSFTRGVSNGVPVGVGGCLATQWGTSAFGGVAGARGCSTGGAVAGDGCVAAGGCVVGGGGVAARGDIADGAGEDGVAGG